MPHDALDVARLLAVAEVGDKAQTTRRRAVSTTYYAMFHHLARTAADLLIGTESPETSPPAWRQAYRALEHGAVYNACRHREIVSRFPKAIEDYANLFVTMQDRRVLADYDPHETF